VLTTNDWVENTLKSGSLAQSVREHNRQGRWYRAATHKQRWLIQGIQAPIEKGTKNKIAAVKGGRAVRKLLSALNTFTQ
jgi:hypothetical protein